jgi:hypothetical protein
MDHHEQLQAKLVVFGDPETGKSELIRNIASLSNSSTDSLDHEPNNKSSLFNIEFSNAELGIDDPIHTGIMLKTWEYPSTGSISAQEQELSFRCTLFCIITIDLRNPETAKSAFAKWYQLKEEHMEGSFLIIVGTFVDCTLQRRIEVVDISKACAQKDALYVEVSNLDKSNISLLRYMIAQRLQYMMSVRDNIAADIAQNTQDYYNSTRDHGNISEEAKHSASSDRTAKLKAMEMMLSTPLLEPDLLCSTTGTILTSALGVQSWPGLDHFDTKNDYVSSNHELESSISELKRVAEGVSRYVDHLSLESTTLAEKCLAHPRNIEPYKRTGNTLSKEESNRMADVNEILRLFDLIGYSSAEGNSIIAEQVSNEQTSAKPGHKSGSKKSKKGKSDRKIATVTTAADDTSSHAGSTSLHQTVSEPPPLPSQILSQGNEVNTSAAVLINRHIAKRPYRVRIQLPDDLNIVANGSVDVKINVGDDINSIVDSLVSKYDFTADLRMKIFSQVEQACCN